MKFHVMKIQREKRDSILLFLFQLSFAFPNLWNKELESKDLTMRQKRYCSD